MGRFDGQLLVSDYDNTIHYTAGTLEGRGGPPPVAPRNLEAIRYWIGEGGRFSVATGRALSAFRPWGMALPVDAPSIVDNGGAIYDLRAERYLLRLLLPERALEHLAQVCRQVPEVSLELYHDRELLVLRPQDWNRKHAQFTGLPFREIGALDPAQVPQPLSKALFTGEREDLERARQYMLAQGWGALYEIIYSSQHLMEMTVKGANKGEMALRLKALCGCRQLYCAGDQANDLAMLSVADRAFAPANSIPEVLTSGATVVCHCVDGALADIVEILDREI